MKEGDIVPSGTVVAYTDFMIQSPGKIEIFRDSETGSQKLLIVNAENQMRFKFDADADYKVGQYIYEGDKVNSKTKFQ